MRETALEGVFAIFMDLADPNGTMDFDSKDSLDYPADTSGLTPEERAQELQLILDDHWRRNKHLQKFPIFIPKIQIFSNKIILKSKILLK